MLVKADNIPVHITIFLVLTPVSTPLKLILQYS